MKERIIKALVAYFPLFSQQIATYFERFEDLDGTRILNKFLEIVEGEHYHVEKDENDVQYIVIDIDVPKAISKPIEILINLYDVDKAISEHLTNILK